MSKKLTPSSMANTRVLTFPEAYSRNPPPSRTGPKDTLWDGFKSEVERLMGDFMSQHGWTSTLKHGQSFSSPQTFPPPHSQPSTNEQPQIPTLIEFEKIMFEYLLKQRGHHGQNIIFMLPPPPSTTEQTPPLSHSYT